MSDSSEASGSGPSYPTSFGRGWIPADRDIGLRGENVVRETARGTAATGGGGGDSGLDAALHGEAGPLHHRSDGPPPHAGEELRNINHNSWTPARKAAFLHHLAEAGNVRAAAARVGLSHQSAYVARRRDRAFDAAWAAALVLARGAAEEALGTRALDGIEEAVWFRGEKVGTRRRHDSRLLLAHLARLDRQAEESRAGELAGRFDELLAVVAGEQPGEALSAFTDNRDEAAPLVPLAREAWAERRAGARVEEAFDQWEHDMAEGRASEEDEPGSVFTPWMADALAEWDAWHARACAAVDSAVERESREPLPAGWEVVIEKDAFAGVDDEADEDGRVPDWNDPCYRNDEDDDEDEDVPPMEYKSMEMAGLGAAAAQYTKFMNEGGSIVPPATEAAISLQDTGNCGNLAQASIRPAPNLRATRQPSALARLEAGQRPGRDGFSPHFRSSPLKARASASAKLHSERQVIDSETEGSGPLRTKCGAITGTNSASPGRSANSRLPLSSSSRQVSSRPPPVW
jgi:hypothetical protein